MASRAASAVNVARSQDEAGTETLIHHNALIIITSEEIMTRKIPNIHNEIWNYIRSM
jgi:hypothetical protein